MILFLLLFSLFSNFNENGEKLFKTHCLSCHAERKNIILPEKDLKRETLENLGMNNRASLIYQISNGKNGMPAFGGRLKKFEIELITDYILKE